MSQDQQAVRTRASPECQARECRACIEREVAAKRLSSGLQGKAIGPRVSDHQEDVLDGGVVSCFAHHPTLDRLHIRQPRLDLEPVDASMTVEHGVPCAWIGSSVERHLRPEATRPGKPILQSSQEAELAGISERVAVGVEPEAGDEADSDGQAAQLLEPDVTEQAALESIDLARRHARGPSHVDSTHSAIQTSLPELAP